MAFIERFVPRQGPPREPGQDRDDRREDRDRRDDRGWRDDRDWRGERGFYRGPEPTRPGARAQGAAQAVAAKPALDGGYLALVPRPLEPVLAAELRAIAGVSAVEERHGAVAFRGDQAALYRANLWLRSATRVLVPLGDFPCRGPGDLYAAAADLPWEQHLGPRGTLAVSAHGQGPGLDNGVFVAQRVKDAIVDRFRARAGVRPSVDLRDPDLRVNVQLYSVAGGGVRCALGLDSSGAALHQRGYRTAAGEAPMKETLAAALVLLSGYGETADGDAAEPVPLVDLCCGSGTLLIEGGLRALRMPPGRSRGFAFQRWPSFDRGLWRTVLDEVPAPRTVGPFLYGGDSDPAALRLATRAAEGAGLSKVMKLSQQRLEDAAPPPGPPGTPAQPGIVLCNPPYGERLGDEAELGALYRALGDTLKRRFTGYRAFVYTASLPLAKHIGLRPSARHVVFNGPLEGRLLRFDLY